MVTRPTQHPAYAAFISYRHREPDQRWAAWLQRKLEGFRVPRSLAAAAGGRRLGPVFRDDTGLRAGHDLSTEIREALQASAWLIVVCSPRTPESEWVNQEIEYFRRLGRGDHVLALLLEGTPSGSFPSALRSLLDEPTNEAAPHRTPFASPFAPDVRKGAGVALLRILAPLLGCTFDDLFQRDRRRRLRLALLWCVAGLALVAGVLFTMRESSRRSALGEAARARAHASSQRTARREVKSEVQTLSERVQVERLRCFQAFTPAAQRGAFSAMELRLRELQARDVALVRAIEVALARAVAFEEPWGGVLAATQDQLADHHFERWKEAVATGQQDLEESSRSEVLRHDTTGRLAEAMRPVGQLVVEASREGALVHLFRYVQHGATGHGARRPPRLVPVPVGVGSLDLDALFADPCLVVTDVARDSPLHGQVAPGDLITAINGLPASPGLWVVEVADQGAAIVLGVAVLDRMTRLFGTAVEAASDGVLQAEDERGRREPAATGDPRPVLLEASFQRAAGSPEVVVEFPEDQPSVAGAGVRRVGDAATVLRDARAPGNGYTLHILRGGRSATLTVPAERRSGLSVRATACPLVRAEENVVSLGVPLTLPAGSYLLFATSSGYVEHRLPLCVAAGASLHVRVELRERREAPPGFVPVQLADTFLYAGDARATFCGPVECISRGSDPVLARGFWIAEREVTYGEWFAFVNDKAVLPGVLERRSTAGDQATPLPRDNARPAGWATWDAGSKTFVSDESSSTPVMGITYEDAVKYVAWRNDSLTAQGAPYVLDLPTEREWELVARGADGRAYPWGERFDFTLCTGMHSRPYQTYRLGSHLSVCDESPYGVFDMAGSRAEWCRSDERTVWRILRGGSWAESVPDAFRCGSRTRRAAHAPSRTTGLRLVARLRTAASDAPGPDQEPPSR